MTLRKREDFPTLEAYRDSLYARLELGYARIERALAEGRDIAGWEDLWLQLLQDYEKVCTELQRELAREPAPRGPLVQAAMPIAAGRWS